MKICIPTIGEDGINDHVGEHFGRVPSYTIVNLETNEVKVIPNTSEHMGGQGYPPEIMAKEGVHIMVCRGLGRRAITMFEEMGIEVYIGAFGTVKDAIEDFKKGRLKKAGQSNACGQHAFRDHHHHNNNCNH
jgi:predicted Fe-Mo cluster-binding NifX family protein